MEKVLKHTISDLLEASSHFNINDILVDVEQNAHNVWLGDQLKIDLNTFPKKILKDALSNIKETGIHSLCRMKGVIFLNDKKNTYKSPIFLSPLEYKVDKIKNEVTFTPNENNTFLNPFVLSYLKKHAVEIPPNSMSFDASQWLTFLKNHGFKIDLQIVGIGNFHHHRYEVLKELEELIESDTYSSALKQLLTGEGKTKQIVLSEQQLFPSDQDHRAIFKACEKQNLVVQGPPGTGKSQLLTNLVSKAVNKGLFTLIISEKYAALEVIKKRLSEFGLDKLCSVAISNKSSKLFLTQLEKTWQYFEKKEFLHTNYVYLKKNYEDNLQMTLDILNHPKLIGGVSYYEFRSSQPKIADSVLYVSSAPNIPAFKLVSKTIKTIYQFKLAKTLGKLNWSFFNSKEFQKIDASIKKWKITIEELGDLFHIETWSDLTKAMQMASQIQIFENEILKQHAAILTPHSSQQKKFLRLSKKFAKLQLSNVEKRESHWKITPSKIELEDLLSQVNNTHLIARIKFKNRWRKLSTLSINLAEKAIQQELERCQKLEQLSQIKIKFCDLNVNNPEIEINQINHFIPHFTEEKWNTYNTLDPIKRQKITASHQKLEQFYTTIKRTFNFQPNDKIQAHFNQLEQQLSLIIEHYEKLKKLDKTTFDLLTSARNYTEFVQIIYHHHWVNFKKKFPQFTKYTSDELTNKIEQIIKQEKKEAKLFAIELEHQIARKFKDANTLLSTPANKLTEAQKQLKKSLRKGKSILVKEFAKTRQHPSLRELFQSEARHWIEILQPIWLSNPTELSHCFPMEQNLFDLLIFDEASQIPLQNSLGALQRSNRVVIAGDDQQMGPSSYFKAGSTQNISLLHQASYYLTRKSLTHHYRSQHPDLIQFSNHHFYENQLTAYPTFNHPFQPIQHHYIPNALYENRKNHEEAKAVAELITKNIQRKEHLGIVAFSQEQTDCILDHLTPTIKEKLIQTSRRK